MIDWPWNLILTLMFVFSGVVCGGYLIVDRLPNRHGHNDVVTDTVVNANHLLMSIGMILMTWIPVTVLPELQIVLFSAFGLAFLGLLWRVRHTVGRVDLVGHVVLNAAMVWMVAAMGLLMAEMMGMTTPGWVDAVNLVFVIASAAVGVWQLTRLVGSKHHRIHAACHTVMSAGMALMLWLMN